MTLQLDKDGKKMSRSYLQSWRLISFHQRTASEAAPSATSEEEEEEFITAAASH